MVAGSSGNCAVPCTRSRLGTTKSMNIRPTCPVAAMLPIEKNMPLPSKHGHCSVRSSCMRPKPGSPP